MATRKKAGDGGAEPPDAGSRDQFTVVVEDLRSQFKVFGEGLRVNENMAAGFERVDRSFERVDRRFERVDRELGIVKAELGLVKAAIVSHDRELGLVKATIIEHGGELREIRGSLKRVEDGMVRKVDRDEVEAIVERVVARPRAR
jgi:hypothetical protein